MICDIKPSGIKPRDIKLHEISNCCGFGLLFQLWASITSSAGTPSFSRSSTSATSTYTSDKRYHVLLGLAGSCPPLSVSDCHCLCWDLPLPPAAAQCFAGIYSQLCESHLQNTVLSTDMESWRCCNAVFIKKQTLGMAEAVSSKLERDALQFIFSVRDCNSTWMKSHQKTAGQREEKCEKVCVKISPRC